LSDQAFGGFSLSRAPFTVIGVQKAKIANYAWAYQKLDAKKRSQKTNN
jgi:hypothetical protein